MQDIKTTERSARTLPLCGLLGLIGLLASACGASVAPPSDSDGSSGSTAPSGIELFTHDPVLYQAALRAQQRVDAAIGDPGLLLADPDQAEHCEPFQAGCGFELSFKPVVYCHGSADPALACTSFGGGGKAVGVALQASLTGDELDNRLIHELFHVITLNKAPHSLDGLFMQYSVGTERITTLTLDSVCQHFSCSRFVVEEDSETDAAGLGVSP